MSDLLDPDSIPAKTLKSIKQALRLRPDDEDHVIPSADIMAGIGFLQVYFTSAGTVPELDELLLLVTAALKHKLDTGEATAADRRAATAFSRHFHPDAFRALVNPALSAEFLANLPQLPPAADYH